MRATVAVGEDSKGFLYVDRCARDGASEIAEDDKYDVERYQTR